MSEVIQKWIAYRTGLVMNMTPDIFASDVMDGTILARILHAHNIISQDQFVAIVPTDNSTIALQNLQKLRCWLQAQDIHCCAEEDLLDISMRKGSSAIKLFYQLYLYLHDKDQLHFIAKKRAKERLRPSNTRFEVIPVEEELHDPSIVPDHPLSKPLVEHRDIVQWNQNRYQTMKEDYEKMRQKYNRYIHDKFDVPYRDRFKRVKAEPESPEESNELNEKFPQPEDCTYEELLEQEKTALEMETFQEDPKVAKKIVNTIRQKHRKEVKEKEMKVHQQKLLLMDLWENLLKDQEKEFEETISKKMLKQSLFEKQMATKMMEIRQQKEIMLENRRFVDEETLKKREEEFLENVFLREKAVGDQKYNYYFECDRALELHRRLYAEKMRLKAERHFNICRDVMQDIVDISIRHSEFKEKFDEEVPRRIQNEWANLFIKQQPIFDLLDDVEDIVQDTEDLAPEIEEIYRAEIDRQKDLDERDFENYFYFEWPWEFQKLFADSDEKSLLPIELGINVLGHGVHRVLLIKYPKPKPPPKPDIPKVTIAACINSLPDMTILPVLQKLLNEKGVRVVEMQEAINFCLEVFKDEIQTEYIDKFLVEETDAALEELKDKKGKGKGKGKGKDKGKKAKEKPKKGEKPKGKGKKQKGPVPDDSLANFPKFVEKQSQTPRIYPCEEIVLSPTGELGKVAYDLLNIGEQLTDNLVVAMFIEYLKTLKEIKGWALVNYPMTIVQAALLEEALTGVPVPGISEEVKLGLSKSIGDVADLDYRESQWEQEEENARLRKSRILPNPDPPREEPFYETYLTAYIHAQPKTDTDEKPKAKKPEKKEKDKPEASKEKETREEKKMKSAETKEVTFSEEPEKKLEGEEDAVEPVDLLEEFYMDQGCNYAFFYQTFEVATIKHLAKLIIGEYTVPPKTSLELFGDTVLYIEANLGQDAATPRRESKGKKKGEKKEKLKKKDKASTKSEDSEGDAGKKGKDKKGKDKKSKSDKSEGKKGKGKKGKGGAIVEIVAVTREDKETQIPEVEPEVEEVFVEPPPEPRAGEFLWQYSDLPFPDYFQISLATLWENAEEVYVCDFKELFFVKRMILNAVIPYLTFVRKHMEVYIARPDDKQNYLHQFQTTYNEIDEDMRDDEELKAEVHCRIAEFREKLWEICDRRMRESEQERQRIIQECWVPIQICELTNNCITAMQLEVDRCCDSFQFLTDYYTGLITKMPLEEATLQKSNLKKLEMGRNDSITTLGESLKGVINDILIVPESDSINTPFHQMVKETMDEAMKIVDKWKFACLNVVNKMDSLFKPKTTKKDKKDKGKKDKGSSKKGKDEKKLPKFVEPDLDVKEAGARLIEEWNCAVNGEFARVQLRLDMLAKRGAQELNDVLNSCKKTFHNLFNDIKERYNREMFSVDTACEVLAAAVEAETALQPVLTLEADKFYIEPNVLLFPEPLPPPEPPIKEPECVGVFSIAQLDVLTDILMDLAPRGSLPERTFVFLLQDMIVQNAEDGKESMVPLLWKELKPKQVSQLSHRLFGNVEFVDWKDFIVYNFCVDFPDEEELLVTREQFRVLDPDLTETVKDYQFYDVRFWFERNFDEENPREMLRLKLIKQQLFKLFKTDEDTINYTALLLAFCKDVNPVKGFAKALTLALGKLVCWDAMIGQTYVESVREQRYLDEQEELRRRLAHQEARECAESVINTLVDNTVHTCESVIIEDYESVENLEEDEVIHESREDRLHSLIDMEFADLVHEGLEEVYSKATGSNDTGVKSQESLLLEESFSNLEIGFQPFYDPPKAYFLPFEAVLTVLTAALPWHAKAQTANNESLRERMEVIFENFKNPEFGNAVLAHELLNDRFFKDLLWSNFKFVVKVPPKIVERMLDQVF